MRVQDIMTAPVLMVTPEAPLDDVARLLIEHGISGVPVVDASGALLGMVSEADLIALAVEPSGRKARAGGAESDKPAPRTAADVMSREVVIVEKEAPISEVANLMVHKAIKRVPVVNDGMVVGIVSRRDVIATFTRSDDEIAADVQELLDDVIKVIGRFHASTSHGIVTLAGADDPEFRRAAELTAGSVPGVIGVTFADQAFTGPSP
jgi:CBS domain-containing protein